MQDPANLVYVAAKRWVTALDARTGQPVWSTEVPGNRFITTGYMLIAADPTGVYVSRNGAVSCLDPVDGTLLWTHKPRGAGAALPVVATLMGGGDSTGQAMLHALQAQQAAAAAAAG